PGLPLGVRDPQPAGAVLHRVQRDRVGERLVIGHRVALDGMGQRVHAGAGGDAGGQVYTELRVDQGDPGGDVRRAADVEFHFAVGVGDHGPERDLAPGSGGGGDRDQRRDARVDRILPPLVLPDAAAVYRDHADALGGVDRAAAADGDQAVAALALVIAGAGVHQGDARIRA